MPGQISIEHIVNATLKGIEKSQEKYFKWSGGTWLWEAPEYLITVNIADQISKIDGTKYITMENGTSDAVTDAGAHGRGRLHRDIRGNGKIDIVLWWANGTPRGIIEVKNQIRRSAQYEEDIKRMGAILRRKSDESSFQFGLLAFYDSDGSDSEKSAEDLKKSAKEKVNDRINRICDNSRKLIKDDFKIYLTKSIIHKKDEGAWAAACLLIKPS